jgi:hypothetical protein
MPAKMDEYCKQNGFAGWFEVRFEWLLRGIDESGSKLLVKAAT